MFSYSYIKNSLIYKLKILSTHTAIFTIYMCVITVRNIYIICITYCNIKAHVNIK